MRIMSPEAAEETGHPQGARAEETRRRILDAAVACIADDGFQASNLSRIARRAGVTTGAIQHQFGDKATLLAEIVERGYEDMVGRLARMPAGEEALGRRVAKLVRALWQAYDGRGTRASLETLFAMRHDVAFHRRSMQFFVAMHARIDRLWMGTFWDAPCGRAGHVAAQRTVFATLNGLVLERILVPGTPDPAPDLDRLAAQVTEILRDGAETSSE